MRTLSDCKVSIEKLKDLIEMELGVKSSTLIAVGASTAANCVGCLKKTVSMAREVGADEEEIAQAVEIGRRVRAGAATKLDEVATSLSGAIASIPAKTLDCTLPRLIRRFPKPIPPRNIAWL
jgi:AhpD family alkylhydroperoxidase